MDLDSDDQDCFSLGEGHTIFIDHQTTSGTTPCSLLSDTLYELALVALATNTAYHKEFLSAVKSWPRSIYSVLPVLSEIEPQLRVSMMTDSLKEALAELYVRTGQNKKAFSLYVDLLNPEVFDFIEKHNLHDVIREKVVQLMMLDSKRATSVLIQQRDLITPSDVVSQLQRAVDKCDFRYFLYLYLHALFEINADVGRDFHDMQPHFIRLLLVQGSSVQSQAGFPNFLTAKRISCASIALRLES